MIIQKKCPHFIHQEDGNGEMAISFCNAMKDPGQDHEGNDRSYPCPLGLQNKVCYEVLFLGSDKPKSATNADRIRSMSDEELAKTSVYCTTKPDYDEGIDGEWYECGEVETWHSVFAKDLCMCEEDAIAYTLDWLQQPAETEGKEI